MQYGFAIIALLFTLAHLPHATAENSVSSDFTRALNEREYRSSLEELDRLTQRKKPSQRDGFSRSSEQKKFETKKSQFRKKVRKQRRKRKQLAQVSRTRRPSSKLNRLQTTGKMNRYKERLDNRNYLDLFALGGYSTANGTETINGQSAPSATFKSGQLGLRADLRVWKYFGSELALHSGIGNKVKNTLGGDIALKGQLPFWISAIQFSPKLGGGFALNRLTDDAVTSKSSLSGPFGLIGLDIQVSRLLLFLDYARAISPSGTTTTNGVTVDVGEPSFDRIRTGGALRVAQDLMLGAQYVRRTFGMGFAADFSGTLSSANVLLIQHQFLGLLLYRL